MKKQKTVLFFLAVIIIAAILLTAWYFTPKRFLGRAKAADVTSIYVVDGNNGNRFTIEEADEIRQVVENIQGIKMKRDKISIGYTGYSFRMDFIGENGKIIDSFIINSAGTIRDDPFFYRCDEILCFDYLKELEENYGN
ncbi:MAG: hypothetical protein NC433_13880 [Clostridiales bacterium]|nr:hypothetical protein [Clostridiales bacterium]